MTKTKSMTDVAYELMSKKKKAISFKDLWLQVIKVMEIDEETAYGRIAQFYTDMTLDSRFTSLKDNCWDLKERHKFNEVYRELKELDDDDLQDEFYDNSTHDDEEGENIHKVDEEDEF